jgi:eukaryotic-like serine/threonine-protein kinase
VWSTVCMVDPLAGSLLGGRYRLSEPVRFDEVARTWPATDEILGRAVTVKELGARPGLLRLAQSTARLTHEGIITVYDLFEDRDRVWIITEAVAGRTLYGDVVATGPWHPERVALLGVRLCDALEAVHIAQMVHRDVRPGNVIVPDRGGALLSDLATASAVDLTSRSSGYVAPERRVTVAADLFGLGATLFFAAAGKAPSAPAAYPPGVLGKAIAGLTAAEPVKRMALQKARSLLAGIVTTPADTLDAALPPAQRKRRGFG